MPISTGAMLGLQMGASAAQQYFNYEGSKRAQRKQFYYNRQMQQNAFNQNLEMWNMQNRYNSPQAQVERLKAAGLNPHLMYGRGSASAGNAKDAPTYQAPKAEFHHPDIGKLTMLNQYIDTKRKLTENSLIDAQRHRAWELANTEILNNQLMGMKMQAIEELGGQKYQTQIAEAALKQAQDKTAILANKKGITDKQRQWMKYKIDAYQGEVPVNIDKDNLQLRMIDKWIEKILEKLD